VKQETLTCAVLLIALVKDEQKAVIAILLLQHIFDAFPR
jgi:hypothetical protein